MKKVFCLILAMILTVGGSVVSYAKAGDVVGYACHTDIVAKINGAQIPSYNVDGYTYVVAEDLADYGFRVEWNAQTRTLSVKRDYGVRDIYAAYQKPYVGRNQIGKRAYNLLETNIGVDLSGRYVAPNYDDGLGKAYNINGRTIVCFEALKLFGSLYWNAGAREISLSIPGVGHMNQGSKSSWTVKNEYLAFAEEINGREAEFRNTAFSQYEINVGSGTLAITWDILLNEIYQYLRRILPANEFEALKNDEIEWIRRKEQAVSEMEEAYRNASMRPFMMNDTEMTYTKDRCYYLISLIR